MKIKKARNSKRKSVNFAKPAPDKRLRDLKAKRKHLNQTIASETELLKQMQEIMIKSRSQSPSKSIGSGSSPFKPAQSARVTNLSDRL